MKNIFVEGIQGMGKTSLVNQISKTIPEFHVCREGDYSPVDLAWCTWMSKKDYNMILERYACIRDEIIQNTTQEQDHYVISYTKIITDIPSFHKELEKYEIFKGQKNLEDFKTIIRSRYKQFEGNGYLFECSFFQNILEDLILYHLLDDKEIIAFYRELYSCMKKKDFLLLYLYSEKLEEHINIIRQERCDSKGNELWYELMLQYLMHSPYGEKHGFSTFDDLISHFKHRQRIELSIIDEVLGENAVILPAKEWEMNEVLSLFG